MSKGTARTLFWIFITLTVVATTYPGVLPFNRIRPLVLGLPFTMFWSALWVSLGGIALLLLHFSERREG